MKAYNFNLDLTNGWSGPGCSDCEPGGSDDPDPPGLDDDGVLMGAKGAERKPIIAGGSDSCPSDKPAISDAGEHSCNSAPAKPIAPKSKLRCAKLVGED